MVCIVLDSNRSHFSKYVSFNENTKLLYTLWGLETECNEKNYSRQMMRR